jgi:hypothetical protein
MVGCYQWERGCEERVYEGEYGANIAYMYMEMEK